MRTLVDKNGEILFIYDATMCNPNGDPDDENKPRMDLEQERNLVSDVRLKRYIRDYLYDYFQAKGEDQTIYVTKAEGVVQAEDRIKKVLGRDSEDSVSSADLPILLTKLIDVRLFGATMPIKGGKKGEGEGITLTGPVQFNWGYSLNRVQLVESNTISSQFSSRQQAGQGTFGKDYRLYYSLIAFHGIISARRVREMYKKAGENPLGATTYEDLELLDQAMLKAIPLLATRSKIGQYPRLYVRFEYIDDETFIGDLRQYLRLSEEEGLRSIQDVKLEIGGITRYLEGMKEKINRVFVWQDIDLRTLVNGEERTFSEMLENILGSSKVISLV